VIAEHVASEAIVQGIFDLDPVELEFACPRCAFFNVMTYRDARLGAPIICRGCKNTITPDDTMGELTNARRRMMASVDELQKTLEELGR
jgi:hypothetical protein